MNPKASIRFAGGAREALIAQVERISMSRGEVLMLAYMPSFVNSDGSVVDGFVPGYTPIPLSTEKIARTYVLGEATGGPSFYFLPKHAGDAADLYIAELTGFTFQITPAD